MKTFSFVSLLSLAGSVASTTLESRLFCAQASRFGNLIVTPTVFKAGDPISIHVDLTCAVQYFGIIAKYLDYTIMVPAESNNGYEQTIILARRKIKHGALSDSFNTTIPHGYFFAGAAYNVALTNIYPIAGTDGSPVVVEGGVLAPITINV